MNTPLETALLTLRPDLTLQVAVGAVAQDVEFSVQDAYGLALALLAASADLEPWKGRADANVLARVHGIGFAATQFSQRVLSAPALSSEKQALVALTLERAYAAVALLEMLASTLPGEKA